MYRSHKDINLEIRNIPELDPGFLPMEAYIRAYEKTAGERIAIAVMGSEGMISTVGIKIHGTKDKKESDHIYVERLVKFLLWSKGGHTVAIYGAPEMADYISEVYSPTGSRSFDYNFMSSVFEKEFKVLSLSLNDIKEDKRSSKNIGRHLSGCRIGFDAGGSDRKVSAVIDGDSVYSEEVIWFPKTQEDPEYHYREIVQAFKTAASKMPKVDAIGVSSAGIYIDNKTKIASLFLKVPKDKFDEKIQDIYIRASREIGDIPLVVANDGDVTALAGSMSLNVNNILGMAMGTSQAVGYVDSDGKITGWLNELAFAPVDLQEEAARDEWSGDYGVGSKYFSQDAVIRLAPKAGIKLNDDLPPAEQLKAVQMLMESGDDRAALIYKTIGIYLGHTIPLYSRFYDIEHILLMGRVTSGEGGVIIINEAKRVMEEEYPDIFNKINLTLPDEKSRRVGQSIAAASLPQ